MEVWKCAGAAALAGLWSGLAQASALTDAFQVLRDPEISVSKPVLSQPLREIVPEAGGDDDSLEISDSLPALSYLALTSRQQQQSDAVVQRSVAGPRVATTDLMNFAGLGQGDYGFTVRNTPPDTVGAAGPTQYVQWVNKSYIVFDKATGKRLLGPILGHQIFSKLSGPCAIGDAGDPIVLFDQFSGRWVLSQMHGFGGTVPPFMQCVAVSTTSDATGTYNLYSFYEVKNTLTEFGDYPKLSVWRDAYYATFNVSDQGQYQGPRVCAWERAKMIAGTTARQVCFQLSTRYRYLLPADADGSALPPAGAPNYVMSVDPNQLNVWKFHVDFASLALTTLSGPTAIPVAPFVPACRDTACVPQPQSMVGLAVLPGLMFRLAYRNRGGVQSLVANHSVDVGRSGSSGVRWYELRISNGAPQLYQQGTYAPDASSRWMASIAMDKIGDIAVGYSLSGSTIFPSIAYTGRQPGDPLGTLQPEKYLAQGTGSQENPGWGDYTGMSIDPVDDCTFWYTNEYIQTTGDSVWKTRIASFKFPGCQ